MRFRQRHAATTLVAAVLIMTWVAPAICRTTTTTIKREGDKVWLEGVSGWSPGDKESSVHAAQEAAMRAAGQNVTYDQSVGVSGLAFRMQLHKEGFCPSSPHACCGYQCVDRSTQSLPLKVCALGAKSDDKEKMAEIRKAVMASIERGIPVQYGSEEDGIIVGYQKRGNEWICYHPMHDGGTKTFVETEWPWGFTVFGPVRDDKPAVRELTVGALEQAAEMAETPASNGYFVGYRAWEEYIGRLRALKGADARTRKDAMQGNAWIYECLAQYRGCAARYLRGIADTFPEEAAVHLRNAAVLYEKMSNEVLRDKEHCVITIAPYPWSLEKGRTWSDEMLQEQIRRLEEALSLERKALGEIKAALALFR